MVKEVPQDAPENEFSESEDFTSLPFDTADFSNQQLKAIGALAEIPPSFKNLEELAARIGVDRKTLFRWRKDLKFNAAVVKLADTVFLQSGHIVRSGHIKACAKGNPHAIKLFYQKAEGWSEKTIHEHAGQIATPTNVTVKLADGKEILSLADLTKPEKPPKKPNGHAESAEQKPANTPKK